MSNNLKHEAVELLQHVCGRPLSLPSVAGTSNGHTFLEDGRHWHREAHYVLANSSRYRLADAVLVVSPGDVIPVDHWERHGIIRAEESHDAVHMVVHFNKKVWGSLSRLNDHCEWEVFEWSWVFFDDDMVSFVNRRWELFADKTCQDRQAHFRSLLRRPLELLLEEYARLFATRYRAVSPHPDGIIDMVKSHIENTHGRGCSLMPMAAYSGYSRFRLAHLFKERTGESIGEYVDRVRLEFLEKAPIIGLKQKEVAEELGFSSPSAFCNWRRKHRHRSGPVGPVVRSGLFSEAQRDPRDR